MKFGIWAIVGRAILPAAAFQAAHSGEGRGIAPGKGRLQAGRRQNRLPHLMCLVLGLLAAPAAHAQFELFLVEGGTERAAPEVYDFGTLYVGESATARFRLRNISNAPATLTVLAVAGVGFSLTSPGLPAGLAPQAAIDLSVVFHESDSGNYSAALRSDGIAIVLTATVAPRLSYRVDGGTPFPGALDFGSVVRGTGRELRVTIENDTPLVLTVPAISVLGANFALLAAAPSGHVLQPTQGAEFTIAFTPQVAGMQQGSLAIGDRSYPLQGMGVDPPLPKPILSLDLQQAASARQGALIVRFDAPAQTRGTGVATLDFPGTADAAIAFASGGRRVTFPIAPGDVQAVLPFQTGTTAGVLTFTAQVGDTSAQKSVAIAAIPPGISTAQAVRSAGTLEVRIAGFDNTRSMGTIGFTFYDAAGNPIAPGEIHTNAAADFAKFFDGSDLGGVFLLRAVFPVTGDPALVASCDATLTNSAGLAKTQRIAF